MIVLVTGASGLLGRLVSDALVADGADVRGTGRTGPPPGFTAEWCRANLLAGDNIDAATAGVGTIVHCASNPQRPGDDLQMMDTLIAAARGRDVHILYVGIAGIEDAGAVLPYYRIKLACEARLAAAALQYTICRATQFHPFVDQMLNRLGFGPVQLALPMRLQPVDPHFVAKRLASLARAGPQARVLDLHGPEMLTTEELIGPWLTARKRKRLRVRLPAIGVLSAWNRLRPASGASGGITWQMWLDRNQWSDS